MLDDVAKRFGDLTATASACNADAYLESDLEPKWLLPGFVLVSVVCSFSSSSAEATSHVAEVKHAKPSARRMDFS